MKESQPHYVVLQVSGFCFQILIPSSLYLQMPGAGENVHLYTYLRVKEDEFVLYGFRTEQERDVFKMILGVPKIGPKVALNLLGHLSLAQLFRVIRNEKEHMLTSIPGIGDKTAKRLLYELKGKLSRLQAEEHVPQAEGETATRWDDLQQALLSLGYSPQEVSRVSKFLEEDEEISMEKLFKKALLLLAD